jgi:hypothetical protein
VLDVEDHPGFWEGTREAAVAFGEALRARHPAARIDISIDPRPWLNTRLPIDEFVEFTDGVRPQLYWELFGGIDHANAFGYMGYPTGPTGVTPEFLVDASRAMLGTYDRWIAPIAQGDPLDASAFPRFVHRAWEQQMPEVSVWRYGTAPAATLEYLGRHPPGSEPTRG